MRRSSTSSPVQGIATRNSASAIYHGVEAGPQGQTLSHPAGFPRALHVWTEVASRRETACEKAEQEKLPEKCELS